MPLIPADRHVLNASGSFLTILLTHAHMHTHQCNKHLPGKGILIKTVRWNVYALCEALSDTRQQDLTNESGAWGKAEYNLK